MTAAGQGIGERVVKLWDLPVRLVHWSLALLLPALWWTQEEDHIEWHQRLGLLTLALLLFRLFWGFAGSGTARFTKFVKGPRTVFGYLTRRSAEPVVGHNPLGGYSVLLLLGLLIGQVTLGLFVQDDDGIDSGPLARYISYETAESAADLHEILFNLILAAVAVHIAAILFYAFVRRDNLVAPMITGRRRFESDVSEPAPAPLWRALVGAVLAIGTAWWISRGAPL